MTLDKFVTCVKASLVSPTTAQQPSAQSKCLFFKSLRIACARVTVFAPREGVQDLVIQFNTDLLSLLLLSFFPFITPISVVVCLRDCTFDDGMVSLWTQHTMSAGFDPPVHCSACAPALEKGFHAPELAILRLETHRRLAAPSAKLFQRIYDKAISRACGARRNAMGAATNAPTSRAAPAAAPGAGNGTEHRPPSDPFV